MIVGLGTDLIETSRVAGELARSRWRVCEGVFTAAEIACCNRSGKPEQRFAACFAAKEATLKALGMEVSDLGLFREAEIQSASGVEGTILLHERLKARAEDLGVRHINLSIALARRCVGAMVILES